MEGFGQGFITGFADNLSQGINKRREKAEDYFDKQVEYARTKGLENRRAVKAAVDQNLSVAKQLEAVGVPTDIIMAQVNQNPEGLGDFYSEVERIRAKAPGLTADQWRGMIKVSGDFKAPDEDLASFVRRTYDPITSAANSPEFQDDPQGTFMSRLLGFGAMDRARERLGETVIADGLTAEQLIQYGDVTPQRVGGNAVVTYDYEQFPKDPGDPGSDLLTIPEAKGLNEMIESSFSRDIADYAKRYAEVTGEPLKEGSDVTELRDDLVRLMLEAPINVPPAIVTQMVDRFIRDKGYTFKTPTEADLPTTATEAPGGAPEDVTEPPGMEGSPEPQSPPTEAPTASSEPIDVNKEPQLKSFKAKLKGKERSLRFVQAWGNGVSLYEDEEGNQFDLDNAMVRAIVQ